MFRAVYSECSGPLVRDYLAGNKCPAFVGVCLNHRMSTASFLQKFSPWVATHSEPMLILVCDYLERHNEMAFNNLSETDAIANVMRLGTKIQKITIDTLDSAGLSQNTDYFISNFQDAMNDPSFKKCHHIINATYDDNPVFRNDILNETKGFIRRIASTKPKRYSFHEPKESLVWLQAYLLEEVAMYVNLFLKGYAVEVYPGADSPILRNMAEGKYGVFPEYKNRTHISVMDEGSDK